MIKKTLLGLLISLLSFIGFSNAYEVGTSFGSYGTFVLPGLNFYNSTLNNKLFYFNSPVVGGFFWNNNKLYCWYSNSNSSLKYQGYVKKIQVCDAGGVQYCSGVPPFTDKYTNIDFNSYDIAGLLSTVQTGDYWGLSYSTSSNGQYVRLIFQPTGDSNVYAFYCPNDEEYIDKSTELLTNYNGVSSISSSLLGDSPANGGGGSSGVSGDSSYYNCTWNDVFTLLETEGHNKYICYGGLDNFDLYDSSVSYNPIPGTGKSIAQIWAWSGSRAWDDFTEWFYFWNGLYRDSSNNDYTAMWESYPAVYRTFFQLYNTYNGGLWEPNIILDYCQARSFYTGDKLNDTVSAISYKRYCDIISREKQTGVWESRLDGTIYSGGVYTGYVPISVDWSGVGNITGNDEQKDGLTFIQDFFNLAKSKIDTVYIGGYAFGILPNYIIVFLFAIILFRFLSH